MPTQEIPRDQWSSFFDSFTRQHGGWLATLEVLSETLGAQQPAEELPFEGISLDEADGELNVVISLGSSPAEHITHAIQQPKQLWLQQTPEGADAVLEITSSDASQTLLRFRSPVLPELVDGIV